MTLSCPLCPPQTGPVHNPCPSVLHTSWRDLTEAPCMTELSQEKRKVIGEGETHSFFNPPCLKSVLLCSHFSASPTCYVQSIFLWFYLSYFQHQKKHLASLSIFVASLLSRPFIVFWPSSIQDEAIHVIALYFRGKNYLGEISFLIPYLAFDLNLNE